MTGEVVAIALGIVWLIILMSIVGYGAMAVERELSEYVEKRKNAAAEADPGDEFDEVGDAVADAADVVAQQASFRTKAFMQFKDELSELRSERYHR